MNEECFVDISENSEINIVMNSGNVGKISILEDYYRILRQRIKRRRTTRFMIALAK